VDLVQPAFPPTDPIRPKVLQNTLLGTALGLLIGGGIALLIELLDDTVKSPGEITNRLHLPILGYIPPMAEDNDYPITVLEPRSTWSESFRSLRTNIQFASIDHPIRALMVTSPIPRDGKSTIAANLGVVLAQGQHRVSLIDADLRRPFQYKIFNLPNRNGLTDALIQPEFNLNGSLKKTKVENLTVLTAGDIPPNPSELIGSEKMLSIVSDLQQHMDIIIIDTPPVMAVSDPIALSTRIDGVIIIVRPGVTKQAALDHTVEQLRQVSANILGIVMNDSENKRARYSQSYRGYYYQYNNYYDQSSTNKTSNHHPRSNSDA
jgi:capsular exopolysaccharide synthesis family protein